MSDTSVNPIELGDKYEKTFARFVPIGTERVPYFQAFNRVLAEELPPVFGGLALMRGERITPSGVGLLASTQDKEICVYKKPLVGVVSTGSELVDIKTKPQPGQIRLSNSYMIAVQAEQIGCVPHCYPVVEDDLESVAQHFLKAAQQNDAVISTGGSSVGDRDFTRKALDLIGLPSAAVEAYHWPKPVAFGIIPVGKKRVPFFGLPGKPTSALSSFERYVSPALQRMQGLQSVPYRGLWTKMTCNFKKAHMHKTFYYAFVSKEENTQKENHYCVSPVENQATALLRTAQHANCFIVLPETMQGCLKGDLVYCLLLH